MKQKLKKGDEWDAVTEWRHFYCYLQRPGVRAAIKRRLRRRLRREGKKYEEND